MEAGEQITLEGRVADVLFHNPTNLYTVFVLDADGDEIPVVCDYPGLTEGEVLKVTGQYVQHPEYGQQLKASTVEQVRPVSVDAILKYLSGGAIKGVGPVMAKRLVMRFGDKVLDIIENSPDSLAEIKGITQLKARQISENYSNIYGVRSVIAFVSHFGLDASYGILCWKCWQNASIKVLTEDPYKLCSEAIGVDFETADQIASRIGILSDAPCRLRGGVVFVLRHNLQNGHACLPDDKLIPAVCGLLSVDKDAVDIAIDGLCLEDVLIAEDIAERRYIYLKAQYDAEQYIAGRLTLMLSTADSDTAPITPGETAKIEEELGIIYSEHQKEAMLTASQSPVFILTGGPGTGKTTTLNGLLKLLEMRGYKPALSAPTGRAAKRMSEVTGREAKTLHRLLEVDFSDGEPGLRFKRNSKNPLSCDILVIDEMSMVDAQLFECVLHAMRLGSRLVMVGDADQLPSVGAGNVLSDIIASGIIPTVHLSEVFRQAAESQIVTTAHSIVNGGSPELTSSPESDFFFMRRATATDAAEAVVSLCVKRLPAKYGYSPTEDIQVISPTRQGGVGTIRLNQLLQDALNPPDRRKVEVRFGTLVFREGDKVMQIKNNYDVEWKRPGGEMGIGIYNGDIGVITMIDRPSRSMIIMFDDREVEYHFDNLSQLELAYAITVHKSQGNEFGAVVMPLIGSHRHLHYRNLLYTGITRAKKLLVIVGHPTTFYEMAANVRGNRRYTNLSRRLKQEF